MFLTAASATYTGFHGASLALLCAGAAATFIWLCVLALYWIATRPTLPHSGPTTNELGAEPPAVVNLLVNRCKLTRLAVPATFIDLAARGWIRFEQRGDAYVVGLRQPARQAEPLAPYEKQLHDLIREKTGDGFAPPEAFSLGEEVEARRFWKQFSKSVASDASGRGLIRDRLSFPWLVTLVGSQFLALALLALACSVAHLAEAVKSRDGSGGGPWDPLFGFVFIWTVAVVAMLGYLDGARDTRIGRGVCARWLGVQHYFHESHAFTNSPAAAVIIWERYLAYGLAMGQAPEAASSFPFAADDPSTAWANTGGTWHQLRVRYPHRLDYGRPPSRALFGGLASAVLWGAVAVGIAFFVVNWGWGLREDAMRGQGDRVRLAVNAGFVLAATAVAAIAATGAIDGLIRCVFGALDLVQRRTIEGVVVKVHDVQEDDGSNWWGTGTKVIVRYAALDDGHTRETNALPVGLAVPGSGRLQRGQAVRVTITKHLCHVLSIEQLDERATADVIVDEAATREAVVTR